MTEPAGWPKLIAGYPWFRGEGNFPLPAYSEFMPPPRLGIRPYGERDPLLLAEDDPFGWPISEIEQAYELNPGLQDIARQVMEQFARLGKGEPAYKLAGHKDRNLAGNRYWPPDLAEHAGHLAHERYVLLLPLALSRTQDDMGRIRWTFFGGSEQGPERAFWASFSAPNKPGGAPEFENFVRRLLAAAYDESAAASSSLTALGFRILPTGKNDRFPYWSAPFPLWANRYALADDAPPDGVRYLLTFRPFSEIPPSIQVAYFSGRLSLIPFPGSLVPWGTQAYVELQKQFPFAMQVPLQQLAERHGGPEGLRVPQSGWLHQPHASGAQAEIRKELLLNAYRRTSRWDKVRRDEDEVAASGRIDPVARVLFSTALDAIGLYDKPEARNAQIWSEANEMLLDGPSATAEQIRGAAGKVIKGGLFRYRFQFPPMQVGPYALYWHRPLVAYLKPRADEPARLEDGPLGYLTAYLAVAPNLVSPVELWPRLLRRAAYLAALEANAPHEHYRHELALNILSLLDHRELYGKPLPAPLARQMLRVPKESELQEWLASLPALVKAPGGAERLRQDVSQAIAQDPPEELPPAVTYPATADREFELAYWEDIVTLSEGKYLTKDNGDVVDDAPTQSEVKHHHRDLEQLGDYLLERHRAAIAQAGMEGQAWVGELPFRWETDLDYSDFGGWRINHDGKGYERDILAVIPGKNRGEAVVLGDHYDTAYEEDVFDKTKGGSGARLAARGADDNASATACLLRAASIFLQLSRQGQLQRDVWLIHLTGEEFPADCLGARHFARSMVEGTLRLRTNGKEIDLSGTRVVGVFVMDMIAHNREEGRDIFQISPGRGPGSLRLAEQAHIANEIWNRLAVEWNRGPERRGKGRGVRSQDPAHPPEVALYPELAGQVRTVDDPASSLYNTDVQIFSDIGVPAVLFMENYDINRTGYHDTHDTIENIDLDYGAALARICIETVARVAVALSAFPRYNTLAS